MTFLTLCQGGTAYPHLIDGWAAAESTFRWSLGEGASIAVEIPGGEGELFLELSLNPFIPDGERSRHLHLTANGKTVGNDSLEGHGIVGYPLPPGLTGTVIIALHHRCAPSPAALGLANDPRSLGFMVSSLRLTRHPNRQQADVTVLPPLPLPLDSNGRTHAIRAATNLTPRALAERFENLGHNCEFGMVQRQVAAEPLGLLRFAGITLDDVLAALDQDFAGIGTNISVELHPDSEGKLEYLVVDCLYGIRLHTTRTIDTATEAEIDTQYRAHLPFLANHLRGRLAEGSHIYVFQRPGQLTHSQALPLWNRLQARGPNALLYIDQDPSLPSGAVEQRGYGLFHGKLNSMAPQNDIGRVDLPAWLSLLANTHRLWSRQRQMFAVG